MTNKITGGLIAIEDGIKASEEYTPPRKARVELRFDVPDDEKNPITTIDYVTAVANDKLNEILGRRAKVSSEPDATLGPPAEAQKNTRARKAKEPDAPTVEEPSAATATTAEPAQSQPATSVDEWATPVEPAVTITDADLNAAATAKNSKLNDPVKIRNLISEFNPDKTKQFSLSQIPAEQRSLFIKRLDELD